MVTLQTILSDHNQIFNLVHGHTPVLLKSVTPPSLTRHDSICFLSQKKQILQIDTIISPLWIVTEDLWTQFNEKLISSATNHSSAIVSCRNLQLAMAQVLRYFDRRQELLAYPEGVSPHSWIHPTAEIGSQVTIAPFCSIGPNVKIGARTIIGPHCQIEGEVILGEDCFLEGHIFIGRQSQLGKMVRIKPFASIGSDGFGYAPGKEEILKIPQIGSVVLEDYVDIGSGTCVDRATITQTRIGQSTKIDNLVHIAHNCEIGRYCFITAGFAMAGSSKIGDFFKTGGTSAVADHVLIADHVTLAGAAVVSGDIDKPGSYGGHPIQAMPDYLRTLTSSTQLPRLRKQVNQILKHLGLNNDCN